MTEECLAVLSDWQETVFPEARGMSIDASVGTTAGMTKQPVDFQQNVLAGGFALTRRWQAKGRHRHVAGSVAWSSGRQASRRLNVKHPDNKIGNFSSNKEYFDAFVGRCSRW